MTREKILREDFKTRKASVLRNFAWNLGKVNDCLKWVVADMSSQIVRNILNKKSFVVCGASNMAFYFISSQFHNFPWHPTLNPRIETPTIYSCVLKPIMQSFCNLLLKICLAFSIWAGQLLTVEVFLWYSKFSLQRSSPLAGIEI